MHAPQPAGIAKWTITLRYGEIFGKISVVRSIHNPQDVGRCENFHVVEERENLNISLIHDEI